MEKFPSYGSYLIRFRKLWHWFSYLANFEPNVKLLTLNYEYTITIEANISVKYVLLEEF